jgi:threonine synthase
VRYKGRPRAKFDKGFWDLEKALPNCKYRHYELGNTELVSSKIRNLWLELELQNPTRSFKDRGSIIEIAKAVQYGYDEVACASTGNMAYSVAYYAKLSGIRAKIFISSNANRDKVRDIRETHDADIERVDGDFTKAQRLAARYADKSNAFLAGDYCYRQEGQRTIMYELAHQLGSATHIIVPVGNATLITGMLKALEEMKAAKVLNRIPKIIGVEASRCSPLFKAFRSGKAVKYEAPRTMADAIAVGYPTFGSAALAMLRRLKGSVVTVTEQEMAREQNRFLGDYGMIAELAGVASLAAYRKLRLPKAAKAVAIISGGNV